MDGFLSSVLDLTVPFATPFIRMFMMGLPITLIVLLMRSKVSKKRLIKEKNSLVHVRDEKVSLYRHFQNFSSHDSAI